MNGKQMKKLKSGFEIVWHIASGVMNIISFIVAIVSAVKGNFELSWEIVIAIIAIDSVMLVIFAIYATILWFKTKAFEKQNEDELKQQLSSIESERNEICEYKATTQNNITFLEESIVFSQTLNEKCVEQICKTLSDMAYCIKKINIVIKSKDSFSRKNNDIIDLLEKMKKSVKDKYDAFFRDCTENLKTMLDVSFKNRGLELENSITIKQLNSALFWTDKPSKEKAVSEARIITSFRDLHSFAQHKREVGKVEYSISGNVDFSHCLNKPHYVMNNIGEKADDSYQNENSNFNLYYNCTMVVPIFVKESSGKKYYAYLAADTLNTDSTKKVIYDSQTLKIMKNTASIIAMYFNVMEQHWGDALNTIKDAIINMPKPKNATSGSAKSINFEIEFLNMVYNLKRKSYNLNDDEVA